MFSLNVGLAVKVGHSEFAMVRFLLAAKLGQGERDTHHRSPISKMF